MRKDVVVLGAGIVGVSAAIHLQKRGRSVLLVDKRTPGLETSFGNAGLIQREGVYPYGFPHDFGALLRYALNNTIDAHYHMAALPKIAAGSVLWMPPFSSAMLCGSRSATSLVPSASKLTPKSRFTASASRSCVSIALSVRKTFIQPVGRMRSAVPASFASAMCSVTLFSISGA